MAGIVVVVVMDGLSPIQVEDQAAIAMRCDPLLSMVTRGKLK
jgi:hypothetical protein